MFAYCNNNPVNSVDFGGTDTLALSSWITSMWWITAVDGVLPFGDLIFTLGTIALFIEAWDSIQLTVTIQGYLEDDPPVVEAKEHTKGARPSTKGKHEKGQTRKNRDNRGEKGDARRFYKGNKKRVVMVFLLFDEYLFEENTAQAVTSVSTAVTGYSGVGCNRNICAVQMTC